MTRLAKGKGIRSSLRNGRTWKNHDLDEDSASKGTGMPCMTVKDGPRGKPKKHELTFLR